MSLRDNDTLCSDWIPATTILKTFNSVDTISKSKRDVRITLEDEALLANWTQVKPVIESLDSVETIIECDQSTESSVFITSDSTGSLFIHLVTRGMMDGVMKALDDTMNYKQT
eukprot:scaffold193067_cov64-Attheya_sp.AAC.1